MPTRSSVELNSELFSHIRISSRQWQSRKRIELLRLSCLQWILQLLTDGAKSLETNGPTPRPPLHLEELIIATARKYTTSSNILSQSRLDDFPCQQIYRPKRVVPRLKAAGQRLLLRVDVSTGQPSLKADGVVESK